MTFFLPETPTADLPPARGTDTPLPTWWQGVGAYWSATAIERDANFRAQAMTEEARSRLASQVLGDMGEGEARRRLVEVGVPEADLDRYGDLSGFLARSYRSGIGADPLLRIARQESDRFEFDLSDAAVDQQATALLQQEYQDAQDMIALTEGRSAPLLGSLAGGIADVRVLPFLLLGGGGAGRTFLSVVGREAAINAALEATTLPSQFDMAERLKIRDPNVLMTLGTAAAVGGAFGGAMEGLARGITYFRGTRARPTPLHPAVSTALVDQAEEALARSPDPVGETVTGVREAVAERRAEVMARRPPLLLSREDAVEPTLPEELGASAAPLERPSPSDWQPDPAAVAAFNEADAQMRRDFGLRQSGSGERRTLSAWIRDRGGIAWTRRTREGEKVKTWVAQELEARGVTQDKALGIKRNGGHTDLDNLDDDLGGDRAALFGTNESGYLDREAILDGLAREISTGRSEPTSLTMKMAMDDLARLERDTFSPPTRAADDFLEGKATEGGLFVRPEDYAGRSDDLARDAMAHIDARWPGALSDAEKAEVIDQLSRSGGDVDFLVESQMERELEWAEQLPESVYEPLVPFEPSLERSLEAPEGLRAPGGEGARGPDQAPGAARSSAEGEGRDALASEGTAAGEQTLLSGVAPITERQRLDALVGKPLAGVMRAADEGLFDLGAREQMDWLDAPGGAKAAPVQDARTADLRRLAEAEDRPVTFIGPDGEPRTMSLSAALDDLDQGEAFADAIAVCAMRTP